MIELLNVDCMLYMKTQPDNAFDLAIVDPQYGIDEKLCSGSGFMKHSPSRLGYAEKRWDKQRPKKIYFDELQRVSKILIIWGGNYFADLLPPTRGILAWIKPQMKNHPNFSHFELAWTNQDNPARCAYIYDPAKIRIHPTQKPVKLYNWLLHNYAKPGQRILDTHLGSGSSAIAAYYFGVDFVGCEIDKDYYKAAKERFDNETRQETLAL